MSLVSELLSFSATGYGADTVGYGGSSMMGSKGVPPNFDEIVFVIRTGVSANQSGNQLCLDSSFYPPDAEWLWAIDGQQIEAPYWGGPYCFEIKECCSDRGDVDGDGYAASIADVLYLGTYMFKGGSAPACRGNADVNGSGGEPDIADLVAMASYMFLGGDPPVPCPE